jgi:[ribosomal protein S5]-alanine N-acetyltransferase
MTDIEIFIQKFKKQNEFIDGKQIILRSVVNDDVTHEYLSWLNSKDVTQFLESRFMDYTLKTLNDYVSKINEDHNVLFLSIIIKNEKKCVGTIKLGPINKHHNLAELGIMIGDKQYWGKGIATEAIQILSDFTFKNLNLHKITAGAYENNLGSIKAFLKSGFLEEGRRKRHFYYKDKFVDHVLLSKFNPQIDNK